MRDGSQCVQGNDLSGCEVELDCRVLKVELRRPCRNHCSDIEPSLGVSIESQSETDVSQVVWERLLIGWVDGNPELEQKSQGCSGLLKSPVDT